MEANLKGADVRCVRSNEMVLDPKGRAWHKAGGERKQKEEQVAEGRKAKNKR